MPVTLLVLTFFKTGYNFPQVLQDGLLWVKFILRMLEQYIDVLDWKHQICHPNTKGTNPIPNKPTFAHAKYILSITKYSPKLIDVFFFKYENDCLLHINVSFSSVGGLLSGLPVCFE